MEELKKTIGLSTAAGGGKKKVTLPAAAATPTTGKTAVAAPVTTAVTKTTPTKSSPNVNASRRVTSNTDQPAKKRKKMDKEVEEKPLINPSLLMQEDLDKKKKVLSTELVNADKKN